MDWSVVSDSILFLDKDVNEVKKIPASGFKEEKALQNLIKDHPELLMLPSSSRIIALAEEYSIEGGAIDLLCVDSEGTIYIVETKLQNNSDRRQALAQLIDYATQLGKQRFDHFQTKIREKTGRPLEESLKELGEESVSEVTEGLRKNLQENNFVLILAMDRLESAIRDAIIFLNHDNGMDVFGVELHRYLVDGRREAFVPSVTPPPEMPRQPRVPKAPITLDELEKNYGKEGMRSEITKILEVFRTAEKEHATAEIRCTPSYVFLSIGDNKIQVTLNADPGKDHGVWIYDQLLYGRVFELGQQLQLLAKKGDSPNFAKIIIFNGKDGINQVSAAIDKLVPGLVQIEEKGRSKDRSRVKNE